MKIYTKKGDTGTTQLIGGTRVNKGHSRINAYGTIDELNSYIGLVKDLVNLNETDLVLSEVQDRLFTIGSLLACDPEKKGMIVPDLKQEDILLLENEIDKMNEVLEPMKTFILPGGHPVISHIHICRCVCRRAERLIAELNSESELEPLVIIYTNRLSDYLFILARFIHLKLGIKEVPWRARI
jgi:cob(I)alamin adenosyltransferase